MTDLPINYLNIMQQGFRPTSIVYLGFYADW